jgi:hypothetical protein
VLGTVKVVCPQLASPMQQWLCKWPHNSRGFGRALRNQSWFKCGVLACIYPELDWHSS